MIARGIGGKVFVDSKASRANFVQVQQKKRLQRRFAASALCDPINIYIYDPPGVLVQIARKFGTGDLTVCLVSVYALAVVRATGHDEQIRKAGNTMNQFAQELMTMTNEQSRELVRLARLDELDQLIDAISIPEDLTLEQTYGAVLMANQILDAIKAQKKAIRDAPRKLI